MLTVSSRNILEAVAQLEAGADAMPKAARAAREEVAKFTFEKGQEFLQEIYDQPDTEDFIGGDYLGFYTQGGRFKRSGALKAAETLINNANESIITTKPGLVSGPRGSKVPEDYAEIRAHDSRGAGAFWRERAAEEGEQEGMEKGEIAFVDAMPAGLVKR